MVRAMITGINKQPSKFGGSFYYIYFKDMETGKSYRTCVYPHYRNFRNWSWIIAQNKLNIIVGNLIVRHGNMVDADSVPTLEGEL